MTVTADLQQLVEHIRDWHSEDLRVDRPNRLVRNVALSSRDSRNGYRYSEEALRQAVPLYENKPVFLDHAANVSRPFERSTRDLVGSIVNPRFEKGRVRGDIQVIDTEAGRTFLALAESRSLSVGMSHVVLAERNREQSVVEAIHDVVSVDAVVFPATSSTFQESTQGFPPAAMPGSLESLVAEIDGTLPEHVRGLVEDNEARVRRLALFPEQVVVEVFRVGQTDGETAAIDWTLQKDGLRLGEQLTPLAAEQLAAGDWFDNRKSSFQELAELRRNFEALQERIEQTTRERDELQEQLDALQSERSREAACREIARLIESAELPEFAVTETFRRQLRDAPDDEARAELVKERRALLNRHPPRHPFSRERPSEGETRVSDASIVSTIKQHRSSVLTGIK